MSVVGDNFLQDYFNLLLLGLDEHNEPVPTWRPNGRSPTTASASPRSERDLGGWQAGHGRDIKWSIEAQAGRIEGYIWDTGGSQMRNIDRIDVISDKEIFVHMKAPSPPGSVC